MEFTSFFDKLLAFYKVKSVTDLADKLNVTRSTVSGWKSRQAIGAILEYLFNNDLKALHYIFSNNSTIINQNNNGRAGGRDYIENSNSTNEFDSITAGLIQKAIKKFGSEEEFQFQFMNFLRDK
ncbi:helix-turn-helix domain-containing protein [Aliarcobacter skirrowii]|uniref:helix-turn-helix domain-containing protein n=1 Tax=Aliarcobacter skirrowii TaxID=28200 RepID=UPI000833468D|nr:helix-turn-helix domain-containing protein [Aliarcobacter skirrowii]